MLVLRGMIEVNTFAASKANKWNDLVERNPYASAYHLWEWGETLSFTYGYQKYYLAATHNHNLVGLFPLVHVQSRIYGNRLISLPFCEYGGPIADPSLDIEETQLIIEALLDAADKLARSLKVQYVETRSPSLGVACDCITVKGYQDVRSYVTFRINLSVELDELWAGLHRKTRNAVRKPMKEGVKVKDVEGTEQLDSYYRLYLQTQKRHGTPPHDHRLFERLFDVFSDAGKIRLLMAEYRGNLIGGVIMLRYDETIFWWNNVTDIRHRSLNPTNLLVWKMIEWGAQNGYRTLDLGRTRKGTAIYHFKSRWGGQEAHLRDFVHFLNSEEKEVPDPSQKKYRYLSKLWSSMPTSLAKILGPKVRGDAGL